MIKQWHILVVSAAVCLLLGLAGYLYYKYEYRSIKQSAEYEITTIGTLKIRQIEQWHKEKLSDARVVLQSPFFQRAIDHWLAHRYDTAHTNDIRRRLEHPKAEFNFENIFFMGIDGTLLMSIASGDTSVCPATIEKVRAASMDSVIVASDFYFCQVHQKIHYDFIAPIRDSRKRLATVLVFRIDPNEYLYPLVQAWPTPSRSAETMIVRREGHRVLFLSELRQRKNSAMQYSLSLDLTEISAVQAALGAVGIYRGVNYGGKDVLAYLGSIPDTHWKLVAEVESAEIFSELYYRAAATAIITLVLILLMLSGSAFFYNARQKRLYIKLFMKERELHERLEEFKTILYSIGDGVITTDIKGTIRQMNHAAAGLTGWDESEAQGKRLYDVFRIVHHETHEPIEYEISRVHGEGATITAAEYTLLVSKDDREIPISFSGAPIRNEQGRIQGTVLVFRDKTNEFKAEDDRKRLEYQLYRSQRAESIGTLAAGIAHDFNNILNVIVGNAELLSVTPFDPEKTPRRIASIIKASERGTEVVRQLLAVARKTDIEHLPVNVNDIILELSKLLYETFPKTVAVSFNLSPDLPNVNGDVNQLHQVILNLSVNARDAMPAGGTLSFTTSTVSGEEIADRFAEARRQIRYVRLTVADTGEGMDDQTRKQIFDPFFTTKEKGKGTGLGLAVAQGIIESHGGFVEVHSKIGHGSRFDIYLPADLAHAIASHESRAGLQEAEVSTRHETILYIEDEEYILEIGVEILEGRGYRVLTAPDGEQGVSVFRAHQGEISLVVSDYGLPKFDGEEVYKRIRMIDPNVPFVIATGFMAPDKRTALLRLGVADILSKPFRPSDLLAVVNHLLQNKPA